MTAEDNQASKRQLRRLLRPLSKPPRERKRKRATSESEERKSSKRKCDEERNYERKLDEFWDRERKMNQVKKLINRIEQPEKNWICDKFKPCEEKVSDDTPSEGESDQET